MDTYKWLVEQEQDLLYLVEQAYGSRQMSDYTDFYVGLFEDDLRMYENICSEPCDGGVPLMPPEILALYISEPGTIDEAPREADVWQNVGEYEELSIA